MKFNRRTLVAFILAFVAIGSVLVYHSLAAGGFNSADEVGQIAAINSTRAAHGLPTLATQDCLTKIARGWSQTMSTSTFQHNPNVVSQIQQNCPKNLSWEGENIAAQGSNCTLAASDPCAANLYKGFLGSPDHYANIVNTRPLYVGVGIYVDSRGNEWITQNYATYNWWTLRGSATASSSTAARAVNITASAGQAVTFYHDVNNDGPNTATFQEHVNTYHYSSSGALLTSGQTNIGTQTVGVGGVYVWTNNATIPRDATTGNKYCHAIYYSNATGPNSGGGISKLTCITVK